MIQSSRRDGERPFVPLIPLLRKRVVQGFDYDGVGILVHVVEHFSYHTGQIAYFVKARKGIDLGFYRGVDLSRKNKA